MAIERKKAEKINLNLDPMIDVVFLILIYFIVSIQMEPSLDDRIKLSDALRSKKQEESQLQIYVLKPKLFPDGSINPDSTGLIAFADRAGKAEDCLHCGAKFLDPEGAPIEGALRIVERTVIDNAGQEVEVKERFCTNCGNNILFVKLDEVSEQLKKRKNEVVQLIAEGENIVRSRQGRAPVDSAWVRDKRNNIPLMIKADRNTFYGRILQVVQKAKEAGIFNFAFVTSAESNIAALEE
ncbi:MAG: ExbD/TolR family protein [Fibrobacterota bacterium]